MGANVWTGVLAVILVVAGSFALGSVARFLLWELGHPAGYAANVGGLVALAAFLLAVGVLAYRRFSPF
jgi:hypothetical protein